MSIVISPKLDGFVDRNATKDHDNLRVSPPNATKK